MKGMPLLSDLHKHSLVDKALLVAVQTQKDLGDKHVVRVEAEYERDPDEHEFYLIQVGKGLADLLTCCQHLEHIPHYVANYRDTPAMKRAGINRHKHLVLHIEGYLIRVGGLVDRCLKLVDAVFHLLNSSRNITAQVVLSNIKVARTEVPARMKDLTKLVQTYAAARNSVVHHQAYTDDDLRMLEMYHLLRRGDEVNGSPSRENVHEIIQELTVEVIRKKKREFVDFNSKLAAVIPELLTELEKAYDQEAKRLKSYIGE